MTNVFHIVSDKAWAGPEQYAHDLISRLKDDDFYIEVVCRKHEHILDRFRSLEVPISILPLKGLTDLDSPVRLARLLKHGNNVVHVHSFHDAFTAVLAKHISENPNVRIVLTVHGLTKPRLNYITRKVYREVDRFVFGSQKAFNCYMGHASKIAISKACVIRESVLRSTQPAGYVIDLRHKLGIKPEQALIMFHGRLCHEKGVDVALRALTQLDKNSYRMVVIGEGQNKFVSHLKGFIVANQMVRNVTFLGFEPNVQPLISQCDIGVVPSVTPESMGISTLEYIMQGKAVITTNNGAQPEYINDGSNGLLVPPGDHFAVANAIKTLIDNPALRTSLGKQAQTDFDNHLNYDHFYMKMNELYRSLFTD